MCASVRRAEYRPFAPGRFDCIMAVGGLDDFQVNRVRIQMQLVMGWLAVFSSAFFFYMATVTIRWAQSEVAIDPAFFVFGRFALGFLIVAASMAVQRRSLRANRYGFLIGRTLSNTFAVFCFYQAVAATTVANANILNMTYPIFVALFAWLFLREQRDGVVLAMVPMALRASG